MTQADFSAAWTVLAAWRGQWNGTSFFDDAADQRRDRRADHLSRDARRL